MSSLFKLEGTVSLEDEVIVAFDIDYIINEEVSEHRVLLLLHLIKFKRVGNVMFWHDQEMVIADGTFWHRDIEMPTLAPNDEIVVDGFVLEAEPAVLILLHLHSLHLKVNLEEASLEGQLFALRHECFRLCLHCKLDKAIRLLTGLVTTLLWSPATSATSTTPRLLLLTPIEVLKVFHFAMLLDELLDLLLGQVLLEAGDVDKIAISLIHPVIIIHFALFSQGGLYSCLLLPLKDDLAKLESALAHDHFLTERIWLGFLSLLLR